MRVTHKEYGLSVEVTVPVEWGAVIIKGDPAMGELVSNRLSIGAGYGGHLIDKEFTTILDIVYCLGQVEEWELSEVPKLETVVLPEGAIS